MPTRITLATTARFSGAARVYESQEDAMRGILDRQVLPGEVMGPLRQGRKFSFMTDTGYVPGAVDFVRGSDLLICEGMFAEELAADAQDKKHLTARQAARLASLGEVKRLGLIHYSPRYTDRELKGLLAEAREIFPEAFLTRELQAIELLYPD